MERPSLRNANGHHVSLNQLETRLPRGFDKGWSLGEVVCVHNESGLVNEDEKNKRGRRTLGACVGLFFFCLSPFTELFPLCPRNQLDNMSAG